MLLVYKDFLFIKFIASINNTRELNYFVFIVFKAIMKMKFNISKLLIYKGDYKHANYYRCLRSRSPRLTW